MRRAESGSRPCFAAVCVALLASCLSLPGAVLAESLQASEVLASSARHFPAILEAVAKRRAAEGKLLASQGAFDLVFSSDGLGWAGGFYDGRVLEGKATQQFRPLGAEIYGSYALSRGDFPIYQDENFTSRGGKAKVGVVFSLLRDRLIDDARFAERDATIGLRAAELEVLLTRIGVQQQALVAYWRWVKSGAQLAVYENLLAIALEREQGLEREVESGARASIFLTENRQNILRRQTLVRVAQRDFRTAANDLGFFLRDEDGGLVVPDRSRLPEVRDHENHLEPPAGGDVPTALLQRPELRILRTAIERADNRIRLSENELLPRVDLKVEVGEGLGDTGEGGRSRDTTDTIVGLEFSVPLQRRRARGDLAAEVAEREAIRFAERQLAERIELEVRNIIVELDAAVDLVNIASQEVTQAQIMRNAEVRRFQSGASDFFLVNIREETAADARVRFLSAELQRRIAEAEYAAATVDLDALGLDDSAIDG